MPKRPNKPRLIAKRALIVLGVDLRKRLADYCKANSTSSSEVIRNLVTAFLDANGA